MKVIIVGGGISGFATYLFFEKLVLHNLSAGSPAIVVIYESHEAPKNADRPEPSISAPSAFAQGVGGVLGISSNGVRVLQQLDENLFFNVVNQGYPVSHFNFRNSHGRALASFPTINFANPPLHTILTSRQGLWDALRERIPDSAIVRKNVSRVILGTPTQGPRVRFTDGSPDEEADLVIGADGVRSVVKKAISGDGDIDAYPAVYQGLVGVGGFMPSLYLPDNEPPGRTTMIFGSDGFFGYGACSTTPQTSHNAISTCSPGPLAVWWSTYSLEQLPSKQIDKEDIISQLRSRHSSWKDPVIQKVLQEVNIDSIYPTWTTPDLPTWECNGVVLVGDAAHALQTSSGQGVSQALEDAEMLGMFVAKSLEQRSGSEKEALHLAAKSYVQIRMPRLKRVSDYAKRLGNMKRKMSFVAEWMMYFFIWLGGKLPRDSNTKWLLGYDPKEEMEKFQRGNESIFR